MKIFKSYMRKQGYSKRTIETYLKSIHYFNTWKEEQAIIEVGYADLIDYINHLQKKGLSGATINSYLLAIQHLLRFEGEEIELIPQLRVKNKRKKLLIVEVIEHERLVQLYEDFPIDTNHQKRYKVILGLITFQALNSRDLSLLKVDDVDLISGKMKVPSSWNSNGRSLALEGRQILPLHIYLTEVRGTFEKVEEDGRLFLSKQRSMQMIIHQLQVNVMRISGIGSVKEIRASVIHQWLKKHNLRQVQYWCGHKYVSSTEAYLDRELIELEDELGNYHPMG